jgi:hypothetical protein
MGETWGKIKPAKSGIGVLNLNLLYEIVVDMESNNGGH